MIVALLLLTIPAAFAPPRFACLPKNIRPGDIVSAEWTGSDHPRLRQVTVEQTLAHMHARCDGGKLVDRGKREIRFYRVHCFGAPTEYALETTRREAAELKELRATYTVVQMTCSPTGQPIP